MKRPVCLFQGVSVSFAQFLDQPILEGLELGGFAEGLLGLFERLLGRLELALLKKQPDP